MFRLPCYTSFIKWSRLTSTRSNSFETVEAISHTTDVVHTGVNSTSTLQARDTEEQIMRDKCPGLGLAIMALVVITFPGGLGGRGPTVQQHWDPGLVCV